MRASASAIGAAVAALAGGGVESALAMLPAEESVTGAVFVDALLAASPQAAAERASMTPAEKLNRRMDRRHCNGRTGKRQT